MLTENALTLQRAIEISISLELAAKEAHHLSSSAKLHKVENKHIKNKRKATDVIRWDILQLNAGVKT